MFYVLLRYCLPTTSCWRASQSAEFPYLLPIMSHTCLFGNNSWDLGGHCIKSSASQKNFKEALEFFEIYLIFQLLPEGKDMEFYSFLNVPLTCHITSDEHHTLKSNRSTYHNPHSSERSRCFNKVLKFAPFCTSPYGQCIWPLCIAKTNLSLSRKSRFITEHYSKVPMESL